MAVAEATHEGPMVRWIPEGVHGLAETRYITVDRLASMMETMSGGGLAYTPPGRYVKLVVDGELWMSDTRMEVVTNLEPCAELYGHAVVAGLGIGLVPRLVAEHHRCRVEKMTVLERSRDVAALLWDSVVAAVEGRFEMELVITDAWKWRPETRVDSAWLDIWPGISDRYYEDQKALMRVARNWWCKRGKGNRWVGAWSHDFLRGERRAGR